MNAQAAYTLDAENLGEIDYETFSADSALVTIEGTASHPGTAKGVMVNALRLAAEFIHRLPKEMSPEATYGREGFIHPIEVAGTSEKATLRLILRDFELNDLEAKGRFLQKMVEELQKEQPKAKWELIIKPQYRNMRYWLEKDLRPVEFAIQAVKRAGLIPYSAAMRGGTDGSLLTERGLPTPNIFTGFHHFHSPKEWISLQDMVLSATTLIHLVQIWEEETNDELL